MQNYPWKNTSHPPQKSYLSNSPSYPPEKRQVNSNATLATESMQFNLSIVAPDFLLLPGLSHDTGFHLNRDQHVKSVTTIL